MARRRRRKWTASPPQISAAQTAEPKPTPNGVGPFQIRLYGNPVLHQKALPIPEITAVERKLAEDMLATMYAANGVGLAAPQVGVLKRLLVIDVNRDDPASSPLVLFNPEIQHLEGEVVEEEGCLSFPDIIADVKRAAKAVVIAQNIDGESIRVEGEALLARVLQHEIDHLNGILFIDHISGLKRQLLQGKLRKLKQKSQQ
ncbi:MAG: peptide deformylase [Candidatus Poribacteria bacterium]|nr:peptide deformylase [Candidatus Poribacteria bacterium]